MHADPPYPQPRMVDFSSDDIRYLSHYHDTTSDRRCCDLLLLCWSDSCDSVVRLAVVSCSSSRTRVRGEQTRAAARRAAGTRREKSKYTRRWGLRHQRNLPTSFTFITTHTPNCLLSGGSDLPVVGTPSSLFQGLGSSVSHVVRFEDFESRRYLLHALLTAARTSW